MKNVDLRSHCGSNQPQAFVHSKFYGKCEDMQVFLKKQGPAPRHRLILEEYRDRLGVQLSSSAFGPECNTLNTGWLLLSPT